MPDRMGDLDKCIIEEYAKCRAFYDKSHPNFKDRVHTEKAWMEIAAKLGYNANLLKERMYQLRNRYNLEKRKLETMRQEGEEPRCTWALYNLMTFLDGHIRPRKSYKAMMRRNQQRQQGNHMPSITRQHQQFIDSIAGNSECSLFELQRQQQENYQKMVNEAPAEVKAEYVYDSYGPIVDEIDEEDVANQQSPNGVENFINPTVLLGADDSKDETAENSEQKQSANVSELSQPQASTSQPTPYINVRHVDGMKRKHSEISGHHHDQFYLQNQLLARQNLERRTDKFNAFGHFMATSLAEMPEHRALELVAKFTIQLVNALGEKH
ncbi:uncharacterized protein LOC129806360 isoform X1 [Phlebotomus papatasi]|nr:uncharacterized protein LOC129806360 isoform X1 [Phlebotomus papatasi]